MRNAAIAVLGLALLTPRTAAAYELPLTCSHADVQSLAQSMLRSDDRPYKALMGRDPVNVSLLKGPTTAANLQTRVNGHAGGYLVEVLDDRKDAQNVDFTLTKVAGNTDVRALICSYRVENSPFELTLVDSWSGTIPGKANPGERRVYKSDYKMTSVRKNADYRYIVHLVLFDGNDSVNPVGWKDSLVQLVVSPRK
ncbi:MAG: hypothetical protein ACK4N5_13940 [Myxococcales bacterium]